MKTLVCCLLFVFLCINSFGQLVRKKDYDVAVALQAGVGTSLLIPCREAKVFASPLAGIKMTIPFTRKWFLGCEASYSELKFKSRYDGGQGYAVNDGEIGADVSARKVKFHTKQIHIPLYLKYMLNCNKASVLFGFFGTYAFNNKSEEVSGIRRNSPGHSALSKEVGPEMMTSSTAVLALSGEMEKWNAGITLGYEHQIVKHLNVMCRMSAGLRNIMNSKENLGRKIFPLQACITLSYDIFRIGDCGCD